MEINLYKGHKLPKYNRLSMAHRNCNNYLGTIYITRKHTISNQMKTKLQIIKGENKSVQRAITPA